MSCIQNRVVKTDILKWKGFKEYSMPYEKPEDHLNIWEVLMKKRLGESPDDYKNLYDELKENLDNKTSGADSLVSIAPDSITISAMNINYSRENLEKVLDFINSITDGEAKL